MLIFTNNSTTGAVIVHQEHSECGMDYVDHVLKEHNIIYQEKYVHQFVLMELYGQAQIKNVYVHRINITLGESA